ncbi:MAG: hypothetical protein V7K72_00890 [Nostoc sp.]|uniref:hypothetical protein n=1 Tax=Nostoc sp. TaxID=1180 RepID=UPI002FF69398
MPSQGTGANVEPRSLKPSIDLATVIDLLAEANPAFFKFHRRRSIVTSPIDN